MSDPASSAERGEDERTMEEIMATIGKAVTEESQSGGTEDRDAGADDDVLELVDEVPREEDAAPAAGQESLVSTAAAAVSAEAFAGLAEAVEEDRSTARRLPVSKGGETIEDMVRAMLKPMLNEWLDAHLPDIVERLVEEEIQRLSRPGRR
ncbi:MAG: DUF2497 domain-containing protein [Alphaproteobacteria bacterium]|nr:DUF2497 domain-containing protein [Alphaproteobacteria bacterium]